MLRRTTNLWVGWVVCGLAGSAAAQEPPTYRIALPGPPEVETPLRRLSEHRVQIHTEAGDRVEDLTSELLLDLVEDPREVTEGTIVASRRRYLHAHLERDAGGPASRSQVDLEDVELLYRLGAHGPEFTDLDGEPLAPELRAHAFALDTGVWSGRQGNPLHLDDMLPDGPVPLRTPWTFELDTEHSHLLVGTGRLLPDVTRTGELLEVLKLGDRDVLHVRWRLQADVETPTGEPGRLNYTWDVYTTGAEPDAPFLQRVQATYEVEGALRTAPDAEVPFTMSMEFSFDDLQGPDDDDTLAALRALATEED